MTPEDKRKWISALRSGAYTQTIGQLRNHQTNAMCCLGVMIDVLCPEHWTEFEHESEDGSVRATWWCDRTSAGIPEQDTLDAFGLPNSALSDVIPMNDRGNTFAEIADFIEASEW